IQDNGTRWSSNTYHPPRFNPRSQEAQGYSQSPHRNSTRKRQPWVIFSHTSTCQTRDHLPHYISPHEREIYRGYQGERDYRKWGWENTSRPYLPQD
ncbi:hypothetical protein SK128_001579, partial [Halocaridina rubra]